MKHTMQKTLNREKRRRRIRSTVRGTADRPRLAFFRSNRQVYAQIIDDTAGRTLVGASSLNMDDSAKGAVARAERMGIVVAEQAKKQGITSVVFDRGGFVYTGSVRAFADAARNGGLKF